MTATKDEQIYFKLDEILEIKGVFFKIVLLDWTARKMCLKQISREEVDQLSEAL